MEHKLLQNLTEYRTWAWETYQSWVNHTNDFYSSSADQLAPVIGLCPVLECWDSVFDENGIWQYDIDEDGNQIPEDTVDTIKLADWIQDIDFPAVVIYSFAKDWDRIGVNEIYICDFVSLSEFGL